MLTKRTNGGLAWVDLENPTGDEVRQVVDEYHVHPLIAHELSVPTIRPKVDFYGDMIYLILHFPSPRQPGGEILSDQEVDFIIGKNFIVTARYGPVDALHSFSKDFEVEAILERGNFGKHAGFIFSAMVNGVYESILRRIEGMKDSLEEIEGKIFKGEEREMVGQLSKISRDLLDFKRSTSLHREILDSFEVAAVKFFGDDFKFHLRAVIGGYYKVENAIRNNMEFVGELRETNNALLTTKQNRITQALTVVAFIALPLTVITSLFQIETRARPLIGQPNDFWILVGMLVFLALVMAGFFRWKKWL